MAPIGAKASSTLQAAAACALLKGEVAPSLALPSALAAKAALQRDSLGINDVALQATGKCLYAIAFVRLEPAMKVLAPANEASLLH